MEKLKSNASESDIINKVNQIIEWINKQPNNPYVGNPPNPYDLNSVAKAMKKRPH